MKIESKQYREAAKGMDCTIQIPGICNHRPETTVFCHFSDESSGTRRKSDDISGGDGCSDCHAAIDGRAHRKEWDRYSDADKEWFIRRSQTRTLRRRIEQGIVQVKGMKFLVRTARYL